MSELPRVMAQDRQQGKTSALVDWLLDGHVVDGWPGWSRVIVFVDAKRQMDVTRTHNHRVVGLVPGGLGKVGVTVSEWARFQHGLARGIEWALDDADAFIAERMGMPNVMTMTARAVDDF